MAYTNLNDLFKGICDAIRAKKGTTGTINHQNIPNEIASIKSGGLKYKHVLVQAQNYNGNVFSFVLDDFDNSQDYIKFIFGGTAIVDQGFITHFYGEENTSNGLSWALECGGSLHPGDGMLSISRSSGNQFVMYCGDSNIHGEMYLFQPSAVFSLYVVYGH